MTGQAEAPNLQEMWVDFWVANQGNPIANED